MTRRLVDASGAPWFILSARYGLLHPDQVMTLNALSMAERRA